MRIIALTGAKQVGKSTVAAAIADILNEETHIISFADPMRAMLQAMGISSFYLSNQLYKEREIDGLGKSARYLMQTLGTEWGRGMIDENIWLWAMKHRVEQTQMDGAKVVVIDDCRFDNEASWVLKAGGMVASLFRDGIEYGSDSHASEQPIDSEKVTIICDAGDDYAAAERIINHGS